MSSLPPEPTSLFDATCCQHDLLSQLASSAITRAQEDNNPEAVQVLRQVVTQVNSHVSSAILSRQIEFAAQRLLQDMEVANRQAMPVPAWLGEAAAQISSAMSRATEIRSQHAVRAAPAQLARARQMHTELWLNTIDTTLSRTVMSLYANSASCTRARDALQQLKADCMANATGPAQAHSADQAQDEAETGTERAIDRMRC